MKYIPQITHKDRWIDTHAYSHAHTDTNTDRDKHTKLEAMVAMRNSIPKFYNQDTVRIQPYNYIQFTIFI